MKKVRIFIFLVLLSLVSCALSCSCEGGGSPSGVVKAYYTAANDGDIDEAMEYVDIGSILAPGEMEVGGLDGDIEKIEIVDEQRGKEFGVEMASVTVKVYYTPKGSQEHFGRIGDVYNVFLEKHDSGWKIEYINQTRSITGSVDEDNSVTVNNDDDYYSDNNDNSTPSQEYEGEVYTASNYPKNPKTPGEVVAAYWFLAKEGNYLEASRLQQSASEEMLRQAVSQYPEKMAALERIEIVQVTIDGEEARVNCILYFNSNNIAPDEFSIPLTIIEGEWIIL